MPVGLTFWIFKTIRKQWDPPDANSLPLCSWARLVTAVCSSVASSEDHCCAWQLPGLKHCGCINTKFDERKRFPFFSAPLWLCLCLCAMYSPLYFHPSIPPSCFLPSPALRSPMSVPGSYPAHFGVVSHAGLNGELASPGGFGGALTLSPQISAAANAYSRSPMVSKGQIILLCQGLIYSLASDLTLWLS